LDDFAANDLEAKHLGRTKDVTFDNLFAGVIKTRRAGLTYELMTVPAIHNRLVRSLEFVDHGWNQPGHQMRPERLRESDFDTQPGKSAFSDQGFGAFHQGHCLPASAIMLQQFDHFVPTEYA